MKYLQIRSYWIGADNIHFFGADQDDLSLVLPHLLKDLLDFSRGDPGGLVQVGVHEQVPVGCFLDAEPVAGAHAEEAGKDRGQQRAGMLFVDEEAEERPVLILLLGQFLGL